jgi:ABC-type transport system involved in cytochrome bd biosynthesis fused ATPase/permease subunit
MIEKWQSFKWWLEGEWHYYKRYLPELYTWLLFSLCLSVLCFLLGMMAGVFYAS